MRIGIPIATKDGHSVRSFDRETVRTLSRPDKYARKVVLSETPLPMPSIELRPDLDTPNRAERRRFVQKHVEEYFATHVLEYRHLSAKERKKRKRQLFERVMHQAPKEAFQRHVVERPRIIAPEVQVEAEGVQAPVNEERSPGGIILP